MATFEENLRKIRGEAIYGPEMRAAIAEAITQADDVIQSVVTEYKNQVDAALVAYQNQVNAAVATYKNQVDAALQNTIDRLDALRVIIDDHMWYLNTLKIEEPDDYLLSITEGEET